MDLRITPACDGPFSHHYYNLHVLCSEHAAEYFTVLDLHLVFSLNPAVCFVTPIAAMPHWSMPCGASSSSSSSFFFPTNLLSYNSAYISPLVRKHRQGETALQNQKPPPPLPCPLIHMLCGGGLSGRNSKRARISSRKKSAAGWLRI